MPNRLINETSPYLLQHAHNPVEWFPWGDEAIAKAREEDKPILVSIGYSACHWCHVMERESFEDAETAALMNRHFINIKIDREERPDLDHIYMDAVQAIAGNGGWPLNVFLTPEARPFYGGTYYPPVDLPGRISWKNLLLNISRAFREKREEIEGQAANLTNHVASQRFETTGHPDPVFTREDLQKIADGLMLTADRVEGGFGAAPKFPQTLTIRFLLQHHFYSGDRSALDQACLSLDKMIQGGIYDQIGGGFARYATDREWLVPHFEKMLYDNALLISAMSEAFQMTGRPLYAKAIAETMDFIKRELMSPEGSFYSALDADSEGEEGKFYIWTQKEIVDVLGVESDSFSAYYDVSEKGNWEGSNILRVKDGIDPPPEKEKEWKDKLMGRRSGRIRPRLDDKILLGWNALMISASAKAFAALGTEEYRQMAIDAMEFLEREMRGNGIFHFYHNYSSSPEKGKKVANPGYLDDYAFMIEAYIQLQEVTGNGAWLEKAEALTEWVIEHFSEEGGGYFMYTHRDQDDVIVRKTETYDGATPSGNSVMAANLLYLGTVFGNNEWKSLAARSVSGIKEVILRYPGSFGYWATVINGLTYSLYEIVLAGSFSAENHLDFLKKGVPNRVFQLASATPSDFPLLRNKPVLGKTRYYLCRDFVCQQPVTELDELMGLLKYS